VSTRRVALILTVLLSLPGGATAGQSSPAGHAPPTVRAGRTLRPPVIDGRLSEAEWVHGELITTFLQEDPDEGQPVSERTEVRLLADDTALYVGARLFDRTGSAISRRLSARDEEADADQFGIVLDPRHDHRTGAIFVVSAAGVQRDMALSNDDREDSSWDAVWASAVSIDTEGWTAEMRIPFSQLRFSGGANAIWGVNLARIIRRRNETAWFELVPKAESGMASRLAHLAGLENARPARPVEFVPYTATRAEYVEPARVGDPFNDGSQLFASAGLDVKAGLGGSLTLDATVNPDFGQAEVDPAVVNLSAYETFFEEKRRFFIEGAEIFRNFGTGGANNFFGFNASDPDLFYSRRIGRAPGLAGEGDFIESPRATTILGAVKLTGKTPGGWSLGLVEAVTSRERARTVSAGVSGATDVEPLTNYMAARVLKEFDRGGAGFLVTSANRRLDSSRFASSMLRRATVAGVDGYYFFDRNKDWVVTGKMSGSYVTGSADAIATLQRAPQRYFQRPDARQVSFDPARTSLSGLAGRINLNRNSGVWKVNAALWGVSPGFDSNELGFHAVGDRAGGHTVLLYVNESPNRFSRVRVAWLAKAWTWNFDRQLTNDLWFGCASLRFLNYWGMEGCGSASDRVRDDQLTRGGPAAVNPASHSLSLGAHTDDRKPVFVRLNARGEWNEQGGWSQYASLGVTVKPMSALTIAVAPELSRSNDLAQYVRTETDAGAAETFGQRYVFGTLHQTQVVLTTRVNYVLTPRASLQVFMQPLLANGGYDTFRELKRPGTYEFLDYGSSGTSIDYDAALRRFSVDPDGTGAAPAFGFDNPDFNFKSLRVNAVFRWEFRAGSTFYAVWTEQREDFGHPGNFSFRRDAAALWRAPSNDILLLKIAYWLGRWMPGGCPLRVGTEGTRRGRTTAVPSRRCCGTGRAPGCRCTHRPAFGRRDAGGPADPRRADPAARSCR
jgi:hypothetical protein